MEIGGYFELELGREKSFPFSSSFLKLNSGRNALQYILQTRKDVKKVHLPYFTCDVVIEPLIKLGISYEFYKIDKNLEIVWDSLKYGNGDWIVYNNFFGLKDNYINHKLIKIEDRLIVDNSQALFSNLNLEVPSFYSPRKFLGLPDGGFAFLPGEPLDVEAFSSFERDESWDRVSHLIKRLEKNGEFGYKDFKQNSLKLSNQPIKKMSILTQKLIRSIDFAKVRERRRSNFWYLHENLKLDNVLKFNLEPETVPMVYPFYSKTEGLREKLIKNKIFVATYWPNVFTWCEKDSTEYGLAKNIIPLPIDQRYGRTEMGRIVNIIKE